MLIRSTGFAAAVTAAGLLMCISGAGQALSATTQAKTSTDSRPIVLSKYKKHHAQAGKQAGKKSRTAALSHRSKRDASMTPSEKTSPEAKSTRLADAAPAEAHRDNAKPPLPPAVANAHDEALMAADEARNIAALDNPHVKTVDGVEIAESDPPEAADTPMDDNMASTQAPTTAAPTAVSLPPPAPGKVTRAMPSGERQVAQTNDSDPWSKTSLIGKIFVAFGSLLTLVSAARLLIA